MVPVLRFPSCLAPPFAWKNPPNTAEMDEVSMQQLQCAYWIKLVTVFLPRLDWLLSRVRTAVPARSLQWCVNSLRTLLWEDLGQWLFQLRRPKSSPKKDLSFWLPHKLQDLQKIAALVPLKKKNNYKLDFSDWGVANPENHMGNVAWSS